MRRSSLEDGGEHALSSSPPSAASNSASNRLSALRHLHHHLHPNHSHGREHHGPPPLSTSPGPASPFLLDEDPYVMSTRGQGALVNLIRNRSTTSLAAPVAQRGWRSGFSLGGGDEETGDAQSVHDRPSSSIDMFLDGEERRPGSVLYGTVVRSMRLIGNSNPRYKWARYWKPEEELRTMRKSVRQYYERTNYLVQQYMYIDRLLDSSVPHDLLNEYNEMPASNFRGVEIPHTIVEGEERERERRNSSHHQHHPNHHLGQPGYGTTTNTEGNSPNAAAVSSDNSPLLAPGIVNGPNGGSATSLATKKVKRTPKDIYRPTETTPLFNNEDDEDETEDEEEECSSADGDGSGSSEPAIDPETGLRRKKKKPKPEVPLLDGTDDDLDSGDRIVTVAIYVNFIANAILLAAKIVVVISVPSMSVLASLVDAMLDFLSTGIVWTTTWLIRHQDQYRYPVGRRRLEPLGVLVFSVIMMTSFVQVALQCIQRLMSPEHVIIELGVAAICIMLGTIVIKGFVWLWCRLVKNSSVQALAADAMTDIIFNTGSIIFPIVGWYARIWWMDALGGLLLSLVVIVNWSWTGLRHIKNLSGFSASADQRNVLLYLTMRFAKTIKQIQGLQAYHAGDKLNVEVDIVLDASTPLRDSHDLAESLGYVLESVPVVDRAFVHCDYASWNLPTHMQQQQQSQ